MSLLPAEFIAQKQSGNNHSEEDLRDFIKNYMDGSVQDYQMSAWLMAVYFKGMTDSETATLTDAMISTGIRINQGSYIDHAGDKHSTGGVGDKITLLLAPLVAAAGLKVPTVSGRGLGFTGGTLDKLESIPGFRTTLTVDELIDQVNSIGVAFGAQTETLVPADKRIYALRDVTSTVRSYPLITSSILSKKVAEGINSIVFDVKCGNGAFMETMEEAVELSNWLVKVAHLFGVKAAAVITTMDSPLGNSIGNWIEVEECLEAFRNNHIEHDIKELTLCLSGTLLALEGITETASAGIRLIQEKWDDGSAFELFKKATECQGGSLDVFEETFNLHKPNAVLEVKALKSGYIHEIHARELGFSSISLGAGRKKADDIIDPSAGIKVYKNVGDFVSEGDVILELMASEISLCKNVLDRTQNAITIKSEKPQIHPLIRRVILENSEYDWEQFKELVNI